MVDIQAEIQVKLTLCDKSLLSGAWWTFPLLSFSVRLSPLSLRLHSLENIKISEMLVTQHQLRLALDHSPLKSFSGTIVLLVTKILCYFPDFKDIISVTSWEKKENWISSKMLGSTLYSLSLYLSVYSTLQNYLKIFKINILWYFIQLLSNIKLKTKTSINKWWWES